MMNCKKEFIYYFSKLKDMLLCADVYSEEYCPCKKDDVETIELERKRFLLKRGYTEEDYENFLNSLDFEYDAGFGAQQVFGLVWFTDGVWAAREEYDGSERWGFYKYPDIPDWL